jgi:hypothetical protein
MKTSAARAWPRRILIDATSRAWLGDSRWHLFTGDAIWQLSWPGPSLETMCGYRTGSLWALEDLSVLEGEPDAPCRLCLGRRAATEA